MKKKNLLTVVYDAKGKIKTIEQLDCCICGGAHQADDCPNAWD